MKTVIAVAICLSVLSTPLYAVDRQPVFTYPPTVDGISRWFMLLLESCAAAGVPAHDVHIANLSSDGVAIKLRAEHFVVLVQACTKHFGKPLIDVDSLDGRLSVAAAFTYVLPFPAGEPSVLDDELMGLLGKGIRVLPQRVGILVVPVGDLSVQDLLPILEPLVVGGVE